MVCVAGFGAVIQLRRRAVDGIVDTVGRMDPRFWLRHTTDERALSALASVVSGRPSPRPTPTGPVPVAERQAAARASIEQVELRRFARDRSLAVRRTVAANRHTPADALVKLAQGALTRGEPDVIESLIATHGVVAVAPAAAGMSRSRCRPIGDALAAAGLADRCAFVASCPEPWLIGTALAVAADPADFAAVRSSAGKAGEAGLAQIMGAPVVGPVAAAAWVAAGRPESQLTIERLQALPGVVAVVVDGASRRDLVTLAYLNPPACDYRAYLDAVGAHPDLDLHLVLLAAERLPDDADTGTIAALVRVAAACPASRRADETVAATVELTLAHPAAAGLDTVDVVELFSWADQARSGAERTLIRWVTGNIGAGPAAGALTALAARCPELVDAAASAWHQWRRFDWAGELTGCSHQVLADSGRHGGAAALVTGRLAEHLGDDPNRWSVALALAGDWGGDVDSLAQTASAVATEHGEGR